jgi:PIN domain nuclease of toxin-antitoxin system
MPALVCDTHAAVWFLTGDPRLSAGAGLAMDAALESGEYIYVPSICLVELTYLVEKGRVDPEALRVLREGLNEPSFGFRIAPLDLTVTDMLTRVPRDEVPDLPDRVIAATAVARGLPLVTRDAKLQTSAIRTIW